MLNLLKSLFCKIPHRIIVNGGAYGRIMHPFNDYSLTFSDLKEMLNLGLKGKLDNVFEKLDGQAIAISWKNGQLVAARNKTDRKNLAENAPTVDELINRYKDRGQVLDSFKHAILDLNSALSNMHSGERSNIFKEGKCFMHVEILYNENRNLINYGDIPNKLFLLSLVEYDESGEAISEDETAPSKLYSLLEDSSQINQEVFEICKSASLQLHEHEEYNSLIESYTSQIDDVKSELKLREDSTLGEYVWIHFFAIVEQFAKLHNVELTDRQYDGIIQRMAFEKKTFTLNQLRNETGNRAFVNDINEYSLKKARHLLKEVVEPIENIFLECGSKIIECSEGILSADAKYTVDEIKRTVNSTIKSVKETDDEDLINKMSSHLSKIEAIGGLESLRATEGIVFEYKNKKYKMTGAFAYANQLAGLLRFSR